MPKGQTRYVIDNDGHKTDVLMPLEEYDELLQDLHDLARDEPTVDFDELKKRLKADGFLSD
ncbi:MAG: type II toxin-antitoxin system Phd/YefM family antitoxin [bacterium]